MNNKKRGIIGGIVIVGLIAIAVCNVFIHQTIADVTLAVGVIWMGRACFIRMWKENP